ncbi:cytochrome P450 [Paraburkholderia unamae]|uniref:Cytochrome P450 n=2 Tax=Paraburkholderia unamae TaxID=219649 RepID=A0ABX5KDA2_9BURK|nr:cytochrome P450 [Paraburkholderia unamae]
MHRMTTPSSSPCPFHAKRADDAVRDAHSPSSSPAPVPSGAWPPGPRAGLTGWRLLRRMSRDLLGTLAEWQRDHGDVVHVRTFPEHAIVVTDPQLARELLVTHHDALIRWERGTSIFAQLHGNSVLTSEGDAWHLKRQALQPGFAPKAVQAFVPGVAAATADALAQWPTRDAYWPVESALTSLTMDVIMRMMFSAQIGEHAREAEHAVRVASETANAEFYWPASLPDWMPWKRAKRRAIRVLKDLIERHLQARLARSESAWPDDLLSRLLRLHRDDAALWPLQAVRDECMTTFLAGHETTAATLTWWAWCMASNPAAQDAARAQVSAVLQGRAPGGDVRAALPWLTQTLEETLRLYPAAPVLISRRAQRELNLGPWRFPARTLFMLPVQLMQHDARWFPEPAAFQPERFARDARHAERGAWSPFGAGPRVCLGQHLAMTEMTVIAAMVLQRYTLSVPEGMAAPRAMLNVTLRPQTPLHLALAPA